MRGKEKVSGENALIMFGYNFKRVLSILGVAEFIKMVLALKTSDIDHFDVNLWRSFILKNLFFVILLNGGYFWNIRQNIRYLLGKCLGVGYLSELGVVSFFTVSQRGNEGK
ncbi:hypothetical protein MNB_SUP05-SYMBIONT-5-432 [hydrothermal vent metagenome]|uniref:Uncharacterized protein n=1 Tax=hydrothermal vent metagenome TaxID=652676 RepID=A0A1W1E133_9ZZZZ